MTHLRAILTVLVAAVAVSAASQRRVTPVDTDAPVVVYTKAERDKVRKDSIAAARDSIKASQALTTNYPLLHNLTVGVNLWDPAMRLIGADYGLIGASLDLSIRNRFVASFEAGAGNADHQGDNYRYKSPLAPFFKIGANYNFMFRKSPDYQLMLGFRYGFSPFKFEVADAVDKSTYWGGQESFAVPSQSVTAGYLDALLAIRVKLVGNLSMGWSVRYHKLLHGGKTDYGEAYYIPGFGSRGSTVTGSFSVYYTLPLHKTPSAAPAKPADNNETETTE